MGLQPRRATELYTLFYDIRQAYDSVQRDVMLMRAMRRLRMPDAFIALVADSLTGLSSCVRTAYGRVRTLRRAAQLATGLPSRPAAVRRAHGCAARRAGA